MSPKQDTRSQQSSRLLVVRTSYRIVLGSSVTGDSIYRPTQCFSILSQDSAYVLLLLLLTSVRLTPAYRWSWHNSFPFHSLPNFPIPLTPVFLECRNKWVSQNNLRPALLPLYPASHSRHPFPSRTCCTLFNRPTTGRHATPDKTRTHDLAKRRGATLAGIDFATIPVPIHYKYVDISVYQVARRLVLTSYFFLSARLSCSTTP